MFPYPGNRPSKQTDHNLHLIEAPSASRQLAAGTQTRLFLTEKLARRVKVAPVKVERDSKHVAELSQLWVERPKNRKTDLPPDEKWENNGG